MIKRFLLFLTGIALVSIVIYLGYKARDNQSFIIWFGLAAAFFAPLGLDLIRGTFTADKFRILEVFSKVTEVDQVISKAKEWEEKKRLLEEEFSNLEEVVRREVRKQTLATRKISIEQDITRLWKELKEIDAEISELEMETESSLITEEIQRILSRLGDRREENKALPLGPE